MTPPGESGYVRRDLPPSPLLLEYDAQGQLLWMSDRVSRGLATLEGVLLRQYFRLELAERNLASGSAARSLARAKARTAAGQKAQRQVELERQRLGRELHTGVGQMLAAMRLQLEVIATQLPQPPEPVMWALDRLAVLVRDTADQVRSISRRLHPPEWQRLTIEDAIRQLWELSGIPEKYEASMRIEPISQQPDLPVKILVYRAAQEALSNLVRHSKATSVETVLESRDAKLQLTISDNGVGFDTSALETEPADIRAGIGLRSLREQAASLGGELVLQSGPQGTVLTVSALLHLTD